MFTDTRKQTYHFLVHQSLIVVYAVELVLEHNLRQGIIEELSGKQRHEVLQGRSDVNWPFKMRT